DIEPEHGEALALLAEIVPAQQAYGEEDDGRTRVQQPREQMTSDFDPEAPLPSYDLEEVGAEQAMHSEPGRSRQQRADFDATDDPFEADAPLPSFPLGEITASGRDGRDLAGYVDDAEVIST